MSYEKWSLGYWFLKQYMRFCYWLINKKTVITGHERIPRDKPIVFAPNHQNALSDPMAVLLNTRFQPVWLARADIFKREFAARILRFMKIMPVYRLRDGKENLSKNDQTFADSVKVLENNFALALFPEAAHSGKRQMLPHKKAVPRIVFLAEEKAGFNLDIQIIPVGIFYSHYWKYNRTVVVNFGEPLRVKNFIDRYRENQGAAIIELRDEIYHALLPLVVEIRSKKYYEDFEQIREIYGNHFLKNKNWLLNTVNRFRSDQELADKLDELENEKPAETEEVVLQLNDYLKKIKQFKLRSWVVEQRKNNFLKIIGTRLLLLLGLPVFIYGFLLNAIPFFTIDKVIRKKVKDRTFWSTFFLVTGIILFPLIYLIEFFAFSWLIPGVLLKTLFLVSMPFAGKLAFKWYILFRKIAGRTRFFMLKVFNNEQYRLLIQQQEDLFRRLDNLLQN